MGACRYNTTGKSVLGYLTGNIVEEDEGVLRLEYHNGDPCPGGGKSMVHVHFTCGLGTREVSQQTHGWCCVLLFKNSSLPSSRRVEPVIFHFHKNEVEVGV